MERRSLFFCRRGKGTVGPGKELPPGQRRPLAQLAKQKGRSPLPLGDGVRRLQDAQVATLALSDIAAADELAQQRTQAAFAADDGTARRAVGQLRLGEVQLRDAAFQ